MLAITRSRAFGACGPASPDALFKKLTAIKVLNVQVISNEDARGVSDELVATVRCNAEEAAKKIIVPLVALSGAAAIFAGVAAILATRRR